MNIYSTYHNFCESSQSYIAKHIDHVPNDFVSASIQSFAYSFTFSVLLANGSLKSGAMGGCLGLLAATIQSVSIALLTKLNHWAAAYFNKPLRPIGAEEQHLATMTAWTITLYLDRLLPGSINNKATFCLSVPLYIFRGMRATTFTPVSVIVVM